MPDPQPEPPEYQRCHMPEEQGRSCPAWVWVTPPAVQIFLLLIGWWSRSVIAIAMLRPVKAMTRTSLPKTWPLAPLSTSWGQVCWNLQCLLSISAGLVSPEMWWNWVMPPAIVSQTRWKDKVWWQVFVIRLWAWIVSCPARLLACVSALHELSTTNVCFVLCQFINDVPPSIVIKLEMLFRSCLPVPQTASKTVAVLDNLNVKGQEEMTRSRACQHCSRGKFK